MDLTSASHPEIRQELRGHLVCQLRMALRTVDLR